MLIIYVCPAGIDVCELVTVLVVEGVNKVKLDIQVSVVLLVNVHLALNWKFTRIFRK